MRINRTFMVLVVVAALVLMAGAAFAFTDTSTLNASVNVITSCVIQSTENMAFGDYDPTSGTPADATADLVFKCPQGIAYNTIISATRTMTFGGDTLNYELYSDAPGGTVWPSVAPGPGGTSADLNDITQTIYGRIAASQNVQAGGYTGSATITLNY